MANIIKSRQSETPGPQPPAPPSPALSHLTHEEIQILQGVIQKQEDFEKSHETRARKLEAEIKELEERVRRETLLLKGQHLQRDLRLCRLCFKNKFADCIGRVCCDCHRRVCNRCGSFILARNKQSNKGRWRCSLCQKRREYACLTGVWFHGSEGKPSLNSTIFHRKLSHSDSLAWADSDWSGESLSGSELCELHPSARGSKTDSELSVTGEHTMAIVESERERPHRKSFRRRGSTADVVETREEEEESLDADQFILERRKCRRERLELQRRQSRRRSSRRGSFIDPDSFDSGSNMDLSPDGRSQNSSMSEKSSAQIQSKSRETVSSNLPMRAASALDYHPSTGSNSNYVLPSTSQQQCSPHVKRSGHRRDSSLSWDVRSSGEGGTKGCYIHHHKYSPQQERASRDKRSSSRSGDSRDRWMPEKRTRAHSSPRLNGGQTMAENPQKPMDGAYDSRERKKYSEDKKKSSSHGRGHPDVKERHSAPASGSSPRAKGGSDARKQRRPSVDASCQISEGDAPLAVLQRAAFKAAAVTLFDHRITVMAEQGLNKSESFLPRSASPICRPSSFTSSTKTEDKNPAGLDSHARESPMRRISPSDRIRRGSMQSAPSSPNRRHSETPRRMLPRQESLPKYNSNGDILEDHDSKSRSASRSNSSRPNLVRGHSLNLPQAPSSLPTGSGSLTAVNFDYKVKSQAHGGEDSSESSLDYARTTRPRERRGSDQSIDRKFSKKGRFPADAYDGEYKRNSRPNFLTGRRHSAEALWPNVEIKTNIKPALNRQAPWRPFKVVLPRDPSNTSCRTTGFGMRIMGGKVTADGILGAFVTSVVTGGPADQSGMCLGDQVLEWNGQNLEDTTFEEVRQIIDRPGSTARIVAVHTAME